MARPITEIPKPWIELLQAKHGWDAAYFHSLSDMFFAHRWIAKNAKNIEVENGETSLVFSINK